MEHGVRGGLADLPQLEARVTHDVANVLRNPLPP